MGLALDELKENEVNQVDGIDVLISEDIKHFAGGSLIDYVSSPYGEGFKIFTGYAGCS